MIALHWSVLITDYPFGQPVSAHILDACYYLYPSVTILEISFDK
jgi:hypothetical protein